MKKLFVISDVHGHYQEMIDALEKAGFDENNENHLLISCGDEFDRGEHSLAVYTYFRRLESINKVIVLKGNHSMFFIDYLNGRSVSPFNYMYNGTNETLADFLMQSKPFETWCVMGGVLDPTFGDFAIWISAAKLDLQAWYPDLLQWLETRPYYYETENYIFTHGAIDGKCEDWKEPKKEVYDGRFIGWDACMWDDGSFFGSEIKNTNKTVVVGHFGTAHLRSMYGIESEDPHSILTREDGRVIAIDATTKLNKRVNVLVIEDNLLEE